MSDQKWVKVEQEPHKEYPQKRVDEADGYHYHFEDDTAQEPRLIKRDPVILQDEGDGTFTHWQYTVWGPIGYTSKLAPGVVASPIKTKKDWGLVARVEKMLERAMQSQTALVTPMLALRKRNEQAR